MPRGIPGSGPFARKKKSGQKRPPQKRSLPKSQSTPRARTVKVTPELAAEIAAVIQKGEEPNPPRWPLTRATDTFQDVTGAYHPTENEAVSASLTTLLGEWLYRAKLKVNSESAGRMNTIPLEDEMHNIARDLVRQWGVEFPPRNPRAISGLMQKYQEFITSEEIVEPANDPRDIIR